MVAAVGEKKMEMKNMVASVKIRVSEETILGMDWKSDELWTFGWEEDLRRIGGWSRSFDLNSCDHVFISIFFSPIAATISLIISPKTLTKSNHSVHIQWSDIASPSSLDWLGIYSPSDSANDNFIGYLFLNSSPSWPSGTRELRIPLVNLRSNYTFRLFRWKPEEVNYHHRDHDHNPLPGMQHRLAESEEVGFEGAYASDQVHLAFTDKEDEMRQTMIFDKVMIIKQ
ncbi:hypothetical protein KFK09_002848 [Dendrobium nobile]|uniref:Uncharacterized protein n=1 Tax=Dendrobium nobile TaxID=94219 RepID=A0A8T3C509_DENNO|nr:hypothetical protein KFK09_002848 [Dendrobium nobile]